MLDVGLGHILFVKMDCSGLQLFVNADLKQHLVNVVLELLLVSLLSYYPPSEILAFVGEALHLKLKIVNN